MGVWDSFTKYFNSFLLFTTASCDKAKNNGVSAMSVSDMTGIPRATVIRKCKHLIKNDFLKLNEKKQYILTGFNVQRVIPYQKLILKNKAKFIRKVLNLLTIS